MLVGIECSESDGGKRIPQRFVETRVGHAAFRVELDQLRLGLGNVIGRGRVTDGGGFFSRDRESSKPRRAKRGSQLGACGVPDAPVKDFDSSSWK